MVTSGIIEGRERVKKGVGVHSFQSTAKIAKRFPSGGGRVEPLDEVFIPILSERRRPRNEASVQDPVDEPIAREGVGNVRVDGKTRDVKLVVEASGRKTAQPVVVILEDGCNTVRAVLWLRPLSEGLVHET